MLPHPRVPSPPLPPLAASDVRRDLPAAGRWVWEGVDRGDAALVHRALAGGGSVEAADAAGVTPLYAAAEAGRRDVVAALVGSGARVNRTGRFGESPLQVAVGRGHVAAMRVLLAAGADLHHRVGGGGTALQQVATAWRRWRCWCGTARA
jgi:hypothetical protein